jgi:1,3-beta-glucanosyltransferase GAS1
MSPDVLKANLDWICGPVDDVPHCTAFAPNVTTGVYPPYSMCNAIDQLSWAYNHYLYHNSTANAC